MRDSVGPILHDQVCVETRWRESMLRCENLSVKGMLAQFLLAVQLRGGGSSVIYIEGKTKQVRQTKS